MYQGFSQANASSFTTLVAEHHLGNCQMHLSLVQGKGMTIGKGNTSELWVEQASSVVMKSTA